MSVRAEARRLLDASTPGPWVLLAEHYGCCGNVHPIVERDIPGTKYVGGHDISLHRERPVCKLLPPPEGWNDTFDLANQPPEFYTHEEMEQAWRDGALIAASPTLVAGLLTELDTADAKIADLDEQVRYWRGKARAATDGTL